MRVQKRSPDIGPSDLSKAMLSTTSLVMYRQRKKWRNNFSYAPLDQVPPRESRRALLILFTCASEEIRVLFLDMTGCPQYRTKPNSRFL